MRQAPRVGWARVYPGWVLKGKHALRDKWCLRPGSAISEAAQGSVHLDLDDAGNRPQGSRDLRRGLVLAGKLDLHLPLAVVEDQHEGDLALTPDLQALLHAADGTLVPQEDPHAFLVLGDRDFEGLGDTDPRPHPLALDPGLEHENHGPSRLQDVAEALQPFREDDRLEMPGLIR